MIIKIETRDESRGLTVTVKGGNIYIVSMENGNFYINGSFNTNLVSLLHDVIIGECEEEAYATAAEECGTVNSLEFEDCKESLEADLMYERGVGI